jgi:hypothetical protein
MSDETRPEPEEHLPVRRLLKELPAVKASPDFEQRLLRRIKEGAPAAAPDAPKRRLLAVPVFAYSLLTLLLVGVISYYTFYRSSDAPVMRDSAPREPAERRSAAPPPAAVPGSVERPAETPSGTDRPAAHGPMSTPSAPRQEAAKAVPQQAPAENLREESLQKDAAPATEPPAATSEDNAAGAAPQRNLLQENLETLAPPQKALPVLKEKSFKSIAPGGAVRFGAPSAADSAALRDSTAVDTLRTVKPAPAPSRKQKSRRPGD